jgi:hypothetical protein
LSRNRGVGARVGFEPASAVAKLPTTDQTLLLFL